MKPRLWSLGILVFILQWTSLRARCPTPTCALRTLCDAQPGVFPIPEQLIGDSVSLTCGLASVTHWERAHPDNSITINIPVTSPTLRIASVTAMDEGFYTCYNNMNTIEQSSKAGCVIVLSPGSFTSNGTEVVGYEGEQLTLSTSVIFTEGSGPCNCWKPVLQVALAYIETPLTSIYRCFINGDQPVPLLCRDDERFITSPNASTLSGNNIINFNLTFRNLSLTDARTYIYTVSYVRGGGSGLPPKEITVNVSEATPPPPPITTTGGETITSDSSTSTSPGASGGTNIGASVNGVGIGVGVAVALTVAVLIVSIVIVAIFLYCRSTRGMGRWQKPEKNGNPLTDGLIVSNSLRPVLENHKGRPQSMVEPFPEELGDRQNSATMNV